MFIWICCLSSSIGDNYGFKISAPRSSIGSSTAASIGDVNADGVDDLLIAVEGGPAYIVFGLSETRFGDEFSLDDMLGDRGITLSFPVGDDASEVFVSSAGDIDNDGFLDFCGNAFRRSYLRCLWY